MPTIGQLLIDEALPTDMRGVPRELDKKGIQALSQELAEKHPDEYRDIIHRLMQVSKDTMFTSGGYSFGLRHMLPAASFQVARRQIQQDVQRVVADPRLSDEDKNKKIIEITQAHMGNLDKSILNESLQDKNPLAYQVTSGAKGKPMNLRSLRGGDLMYEDHRGRPVPLPILHSYSEGLQPHEYWAGTYGARKGVVDLKSCVFAYTFVLFADYSIKQIRDVRVGDLVMGADRAGQIKPVRVTAVFENGLRECYKYRFRKGSCHETFVELVATDDHKVLAQVKDGRPGSVYSYRSIYEPTPLPLRTARFQKNPQKNVFVTWPARGEYNPTDRINEPRALLAGLMIGDGCMAPSVRGQYTLSCADECLLDDIRDYLSGFNLVLKRSSQKTYNYGLNEITKSKRRVVRKNGRNCFVTGHHNETKAWLKNTLGEKLAHEKALPADVWTWDDESIGALLGGIFSTDGGICSRGTSCVITLNMTSHAVVTEVQRLLELRFGIWTTSLRLLPKEKIPCGNYDQYQIRISHQENLRRFAARVPLVGVKRKQLGAAIDKLSDDWRRGEFGFKLHSRERMGPLPTYDLEVDNPDHLYVLANGLIVSNSTRDAGYFGKQLTQAAHRLIVTAKDSDKPYDHNNPRGYPVSLDDRDNEGALLAHPVGTYPRNTVLTPKVIAHLQKMGHKDILVRSPAIDGPEDGGLYSADVGVRERGGHMSPVGDYVGIGAASAIAEPIAQTQIGSKHTGGVAGAGAGISGFKALDQLIKIPKVFPGGATHAQVDGKVQSVEPAPGGGQNIFINGERHYIGHGFNVLVKPGQTVEAGDPISDGMRNPADVVKYKHIGEGRKAFVDEFRRVAGDAGFSTNRRNLEVVARGLIDHVRVVEPIGDYLPDDIVSYHSLEHQWSPRPETSYTAPGNALHKYLEQPVLHYTIGTKIRPSVVAQLNKFGVKRVAVHPEPPPFEPVMVRGMENLSHDPDWMTRMLGSNLEKNLLKGVHHGAISDETGTSYVPSLARGVDFGKKPPTKGWDPKELLKA